MQTMMNHYEIGKQRHHEMMRDIERNRLAKALRAARGRRAGLGSSLAWEAKRQAGRFLKVLRASRNVG